MFSLGKKQGSENKDTLKNIQQRQDFIIHIADINLVNELNSSAANLDYGESEVDDIGLHTVTMSGSKLPRLREAKIAFACSLYEIKEIGNTPMSLIFAEVNHAYICDSIITKHESRTTINADALQPLARLGGNDYASITQPFTVTRPK